MANIARKDDYTPPASRLGPVIGGAPHAIGEDFTATHFSEDMFKGAMDPLLMVDHFVMTGPTFAPHLHAGISAVTMMFEDSTGAFLNRDTLGHTVELTGGDLYWLAAASGAVHEEKPRPGSRVHALQIFVNLPARLKSTPARSVHVEAGAVPTISGAGHRVRVVLGRSGDTVGAGGTPEEMTLLDGYLGKDGYFVHPLPEGRQAWIYAVSGRLAVKVAGAECILEPGTSTVVEVGTDVEIDFSSDEPAHFVLLAGIPIHERFVKHGPLVMSTAADVQRTLQDYSRGKFGRIPA